MKPAATVFASSFHDGPAWEVRSNAYGSERVGFDNRLSIAIKQAEKKGYEVSCSEQCQRTAQAEGSW